LVQLDNSAEDNRRYFYWFVANSNKPEDLGFAGGVQLQKAIRSEVHKREQAQPRDYFVLLAVEAV
jgi:hypothetical protein